MSALPAGITEEEWLEILASVQAQINAQRQSIELVNMREWIGRSSRNSS